MSSRLHNLVIETVGMRIISGELAAGDTMHSEHLETELQVSRSVAREAVRVLQSLGLVESVKRVGIRVLPAARWNVFDPTVIRWRLASSKKGLQLRSLTELRSAVEPAAAELAAVHAPAELSAELLSVAAQMRAAGQAGDLERFLDLDIRFHGLVLAASGNEMFGQMQSMIAEVLRGRTHYGLMPDRPHEEALELHMDVASAINAHRPEAARNAMDQIMRRTMDEVGAVWAHEPRIFEPLP
ncbi:MULTISPECIES: FCD domain-containing protein [unclassified Arthrobacter]|uniref:FadR/GntR family transcriptional regulator n=1 Tax=unclassified Arthrobacter TaxID=235627 RepID=UPI001E35DFA7|nr:MULTISPECIES: FCD domain-containing protein [unclassified Arthrobacter]MCC9145896.1 FCD domain-containing protein [Arthrobacter sp. zg-Y919]MDK1277125.1 FCD domain-containing protein [Arthrobacter sp. zg.Y919]WIB03647.1 FCD domain-containing protein [Arthrobacter sp. zg-Y919]